MENPDQPHNIVSGLWQKFRQGDYELLGEIFQDQYNELYFYGLKLVPLAELVKDTIQDVFANIWNRRQKMNEINNIKAYLFISIRHELLHRVEKLRKQSPLSDNLTEPFDFSVEDFLVREETGSKTTRLLVQSLKKLTERQREVILLRFNHELEFQEIAQVMGMNIQSVRNLLFRAIENIRKDLNHQNIEGTADVEIFLFSVFQKRKMKNLSAI
ncbi:MAG: sigma-70 family RNA polymerase sigma factor [Prolixibacteraceae bacterium]|jgi:RNA polymerase sigma factor (sigma-70 family)|nr:sigma-70 family RNA polymerase sigma factor [Prolixibacteraceae bacterium]